MNFGDDNICESAWRNLKLKKKRLRNDCYFFIAS